MNWLVPYMATALVLMFIARGGVLMNHRYIFFAWLVVSIGPAHAINKCLDSNGRTVYQEQPCEGRPLGKVNLQNAGKLTLDEYEYKRHQDDIEYAKIRKQAEILEKKRKEDAAKLKELLAEAENEKRKQETKAMRESLEKKFAACEGRMRESAAIGMSESDFMCTGPGMSRIEKINTTTTLGRVTKQVVLKYGGYIYITNGVVTAIQN